MLGIHVLILLHHGPSAREVNGIPSELLITIGISNIGVDVVVVKHGSVSRIIIDTPNYQLVPVVKSPRENKLTVHRVRK